MRRSRLNKNFEKKSRKTIILSTIGIIIVLFLLFKFGIELLVNFSVFVSGGRNQQNLSENQNQINFIPKPVLNSLPIATNSSQMVISGRSQPEKKVVLYINNQNVDNTVSDKNGTFVFNESLNPGSNQIKAIQDTDGKRSDFSDAFTVLYQTSQPKLDVNSPSDGQSFKKDQNTAVVSGKVDPGITVTVNGFWAIIDDNNNFSYNLPLQNGDNQINIVATDQAGNRTEKNLKVNYSQ